ncbi:MAG: glutamine--fructose-6-phosphate transaminase (isomerizing) [Endozoicomonadaceae bacterium]|nr:glutamine--fructose-6-phosphate transaminase (isomerizing) [Endozoicomonadaceae bacterium]
MCGIVAAVAQRNVVPILLEGLKRLEYRGYDSAGLAVSTDDKEIKSVRKAGKVNHLTEQVKEDNLIGTTGIAHTRWATHGQPTAENAHPHCSGGTIMVVHNGIIENHEVLRQKLINAGYTFSSQTDTEVIAHLIAYYQKENHPLSEVVKQAVTCLEGAYSIAVMDRLSPGKIIAARSGSPLVLGVGIEEYFIASDPLALLPVTHQFQFLEEGDLVEITTSQATIYDQQGKQVQRPVATDHFEFDSAEKGNFKHYMLKEIHEQPEAINNTLEGRITENRILPQSFGCDAEKLLKEIDTVQIVACGTSYHSAMIARYWFETFGIACQVEIASEFRYRNIVVPKRCLFVTLSQSGETADTLSALRLAKKLGYASTLTICNVHGSSLVRESAMVCMTRAGAEIGVASTKAFTTQLTALLMLATVTGRLNGTVDAKQESTIAQALHKLPGLVKSALTLKNSIQHLAADFSHKQHALFLGRGTMYPLALEGALKLKEISYIHAEAYAAGELKHGPLALIDVDMPVIVIAPKNALLEKLKSNIEEVSARGGQLYVFADRSANLTETNCMKVIHMDTVPDIITPMICSVPLQLLAYEVAVIKGTDIDQPRNLAKSVTVE